MPPARGVERRLVEIWQHEVGFSPIGIDDDYFQADGDSMTAVNIFLALEKEIGVKLNSSVPVESTTIRGLADAVLAERSGAHTGDIVTLDAGGDGRPIFFVPGLSGTFKGADQLLKAFGSKVPFYGGDLRWRVVELSASRTGRRASSAAA